jgi:hypothetical protein
VQFSLRSFPEFRRLPRRDAQRVFWRAFAYTLACPRSLALLVAVHVSVIGLLMWITYSTLSGPLLFCVSAPFVMVLGAIFNGAVIARTAGPVLPKLIKGSTDQVT